jgi:hypothetical protein
MSGFEQLLARFNGARSRDYYDLVASDLHATHVHDRR